MSKIGSAAKVKLNSFDDLFGTEQPQAGTELTVTAEGADESQAIREIIDYLR